MENRIGVSYGLCCVLSLATETASPGWKKVQKECVRGSISDFASLVPKSYSNSFSLVSTLVLLGRTS